MTTIGIPGSTRGIQKVDPTLAEVLEAQGYATAQFGKNHLGDRNEFLPTAHGFDEWFGNLYHLNAEEEPEQLDYPGQANPALRSAAAGLPNLKSDLLNGKKMGETTYKVHLDGYNNMPHWTGASEESARREIFYYDETDLMALRVDNWKMHIGVKKEGNWWSEKYYPSIPYLFNLAMDPMEKMDPESPEWGFTGREFFLHKMWALNASGPFIAEHLRALMEYPPSQGSDTLSIKKALEEVQAKMAKAAAGGASK